MPKPFLPFVAALCVLGPTAASAQIGPFTTPGATSASPLPKENRQREALDRARRAAAFEAAPAAPARAEPPATRLSACLSAIDGNPEDAVDAAQHWLSEAKGAEQAEAGQCLGSAQVAQDDFGGAQASFLAARDAVATNDHGSRARLGAMAGNAALAVNDYAAALSALDGAARDADPSDKSLTGGIATDRVRALVGLKRDGDAATALAAVRAAIPDNAEAWLLSATLSRRTGMLVDAQAQIERAAALAPTDPQVGLEAGVIAMQAGHVEAARKSWSSALAAAPTGPTADVARNYLAQIALDTGMRPPPAIKEPVR